MRRLLPALFLGMFLTAPAFAAPSREARSAHTTLRIEIGSQAQPGGMVPVAVVFELDPGWHMYWRNPGDSGLAPSVEWVLPKGFEAGPLEWPVPERIDAPPLTSFGYHGRVALVSRLKVPSGASAAGVIGVKAKWLECTAETCLPAKGEVSIPLSGPVTDFSSFLSRLPSSLPEGAATFTRDEKTLTLSIAPGDLVMPDAAELQFFPDAPMAIQNNPEQEPDIEPGLWTLRMAAGPEAPGETLTGVIRVETRNGVVLGYDVRAKPQTSTRATPTSAGTPRTGFWWALLFAFVGGLILNLMPCVLPVLSIKILGFVQQAGGDPAAIRRHGLAFGAGVLSSFWVLAGTLVALRAGGARLGWGFQLQSPGVIIGLGFLFVLLAMSMMGVFEIGAGLGRVADWKPGSAGAGASFWNGVVATVVATPCTAPFMGSALGYALTQTAPVTLLIFTSLGLGMAAPYVLLSFHTGWLKIVPKPGAWMDTFKKALGFLLILTAVWLLWVLGQQRGVDATMAALTGFCLASAAAWAFGERQKSTGTLARMIWLLVAGLLIGFGIAVAARAGGGAPTAQTTGASSDATDSDGERIAWTPYSEQALRQHLQEGRAVFVDFTAAWCLSCQVNERTTLSSAEVIARFREKNVAMLKADWTSYDPAITAALQKLGRSGVPCYALYSPASPEKPAVLPEVLTPSIVLDALENLTSK